jgi:hypothetical protein
VSKPENNVISIRHVKRRKAEEKTFCSAGFHKWKSAADSKFDVHQGRLVTPQRCTRCGEERVKLL